jgi:proline iminopeptidase
MRTPIAALLPAATLLAGAACASGSPGPAGAEARAPAAVETSDGHIDAGNGVRLFYRARGAGPDTLVVIQGGPGFTMDYLLEDLTPLARNRVLIFYDQRGVGGSTLVSDSLSLTGERYAEDLESLRKHFGMAKLNLLGHSWGAGVVALYAKSHPERIGRVLLVGAMPLTQAALVKAFGAMAAARDSASTARMAALSAAREADPGSYGPCREFYGLWFTPFFGNPATMQRSRGDFCDGTPESRRNKMAAVDRYTFPSLGAWDWRAVARTIASPALVIHGTEDPLPLHRAREWAALMPDARIVVLPGIGHFAYLEAPEQFFAAADAFLAGRWPAGAAKVTGQGAP